MGYMKDKWIEQMEPKPHEWERRWIPVSERLPPNDDWVLGFQKWLPDVYKCDEGVMACWYYHRKSEWKTCEEYDTLPNITHWMPLPEPPKCATH